ncbi:hypothetical protein PZA22_14050 [Pectobacterium polaris]|uniref:hypothetical protein n=1 Tax=Pectobacterium polaris TaxID=2042057 RepID=UPI0023AEDDAB|nr:hypothetical protein [Pectobacterium polaris]MDE8755602.1 hypothetical protein [Pectobacterium polaris]
MSIIPNWKIAAVSLVAGIALGWYVQGLRWDADAAELSSQQSDNISKGQQAIIAGQALEFQRFNEIARQANQYGINIKVNSNEKQLVYRTIIKRDPVSRQCVPGDVAERLLDYADSLRSSAMPTVASGTDAASIGAVASACKLTYAQAVYWIDPLFTAIDKANRQLAGIRETESNRGSQ